MSDLMPTGALYCLGWIVKCTFKLGSSTMGSHKPANIRWLLSRDYIMPAGQVRIGKRRRQTYQPTQQGHAAFCEQWDQC